MEFEINWNRIILNLNQNEYKDWKYFIPLVDINWAQKTKEWFITRWVLDIIFDNNEMDESMSMYFKQMCIIWIMEKYINHYQKNKELDYLQVLKINNKDVWAIDDWFNITFLLPWEY